MPQNGPEAVNWWSLAAAQGHVDAQHSLGVMYAKGRGVRTDQVKAAELFRSAAETGHVDAQYELGVICAECDGELKDDVEALGWFRLAAEQGHAKAQYALRSAYFIRRRSL